MAPIRQTSTHNVMNDGENGRARSLIARDSPGMWRADSPGELNEVDSAFSVYQNFPKKGFWGGEREKMGGGVGNRECSQVTPGSRLKERPEDTGVAEEELEGTGELWVSH